VDRALESGEQQAEAESGGEGEGEGALAEELSKVAALEPVPYRVKSMPVKEQKALLALMHKHGENLAAMARDLELNPHQWTEGHLQRRIALYKQLLAL
jgi:nucleolar protein 16